MLKINMADLKGEELSEGGEAVIYKYKNKLIKVFKSVVDKKDKKNKIEKMLTLNMPKGVICPLDIVYNTNNNFVGYTMNKVKDGEEFKKLCSKKYVKLNNINVKTVGVLLYELLNIIKKLHEQDIIIGDLNESNVLFDKNCNVYIIDTDSWSIGNNKCTVAMELFKDPKMEKNNFTKETDWYAFAILAFKCFTMLHPFGGNMEPDISILDRMKQGISVIDNNKVIIPTRLCKGWDYLSPDLLKDFKEIFNNGKRFCIEKSLKDFLDNLKLCKKHNDYYYSLYTSCPVCTENAQLMEQQATVTKSPEKVNSINKVPYTKIFGSNNVKLMLTKDVYVNNSDKVCFVNNNDSYSYNNKIKYYTYMNNIVVTNKSQIAINDGQNIYKFDKLYNSKIIIKDKELYFVDLSNKLCKLEYSPNGNKITQIQNISFNHIYEIYDENHYFIINIFDKIKIFCIDGFNFQSNINFEIINYGLHFDPISKHWILILEDSSGKYHIRIFDKNKIIYANDKIRFNCDLGYMCFFNNTLYIPKTRAIRGFNYKKNVYKDFECSIMTINSKLIKEQNKFTVIKENSVYSVG